MVKRKKPTVGLTSKAIEKNSEEKTKYIIERTFLLDLE